MTLTKSGVVLTAAGLLGAFAIVAPGALAHHKGDHVDSGRGNDPVVTTDPLAPDETGCRNIINGSLTWQRPTTLQVQRSPLPPVNLGYLATSDAKLDFGITLSEPSCQDVTYTFTIWNERGEQIDQVAMPGDGANEVRISRSYDTRQDFLDNRISGQYTFTRCIAVDVTTSTVVDGQTVTHDTAPDSRGGVYKDACDPSSGGGAQNWN